MDSSVDDLDDLLDSALEDFRQDPPAPAPAATAAATSSSSSSSAAGPASHTPTPPLPAAASPAAPLSPDAPAAAGLAREEAHAGSGPAAPGTGARTAGLTAAPAAGGATPVGLGLGGGLPSLPARKKKNAPAGTGTAKAAAAGGGGKTSNSGSGGRSASGRGGSSSGGGGISSTLEQLQQQTQRTVSGIGEGDDAARGRAGAAGGVPAGLGAGLPGLGGLGGLEGLGGEGEELDEAVVERLVKQFEDMGTQDMAGLMDAVMQQLLSKDVLHGPMRDLHARYPAWLAANAATLPPDDLARYERQQRAIGRLCALYEERPGDFEAIMAVMGDMQACGQPPPEMIKEIAPGLEMGADGLPVLPDMLQGGDLPADCSLM
ncbi:unnamed protein product [Closterium sp. NIES-65]|nr:unnamed protein product [Closterium sp. NIES-65]